jgi:FG-GAP repeat/Putative Ig domain
MNTSRIDHALYFIATFTLLLGLTAAAVQSPNSISNPSCGNFFERQQLTSIDNSAGNLMGHSVAIDNATAVVGVPGEDVGEDEDAGTVLVYTRVAPNNWVLQAQLVAPDPRCDDNEGDRFGFSVAVSGDRILVGSPYADIYFGATSGGACPSNEDSGSVYVFERNGSTWTLTGHWIGFNEHDQFGWSVALSGDRAVIGAPGFSENRGAIRIREKDPSGYDGWTIDGYSTNSESAAGDGFGWSVAISGNTVIAGAPFDDLGTLAELGTAYTFKRADLGSWYLHQQLIPLNGAAHDQLGISVAISPDEQILVAGAHYDREVFASQGSAYVYRKNDANYVYQKKLTATDARIGDQFGEVVATNGREIIVGAYSDDDTGAPDKGSVYVFKHNGISWAQTNKITASDGAAGDQFGGAVAISGTTVIVGAQANDQPGLVDIGSAYLFTCGACPTITINPATLPQGRVGALYNQTLTATGGTAPYTFSVSQGTLPPGVTLATNGVLS